MTLLSIEFASPLYDESVALRYEVLRKPLGRSFTEEQLALEWSDYHLAALDASGQMRAILLLTPQAGGVLKMRQVAVAPEWQGRGVGAALVEYSEAFAKSQNFNKIALHARETAVPFYRRLGYEFEAGLFEEVGIPHLKMWKNLDTSK